MRYKKSNHKLNTIWIQSNKNTLNIKNNKIRLNRIKNFKNSVIILYSEQKEEVGDSTSYSADVHLNPNYL